MDKRDNWISLGGYIDYTDGELYTVAFYFTVTKIVTVGYGDVTPKNDGERIFCVIWSHFVFVHYFNFHNQYTRYVLPSIRWKTISN